jgi:hypothetical protein
MNKGINALSTFKENTLSEFCTNNKIYKIFTDGGLGNCPLQ